MTPTEYGEVCDGCGKLLICRSCGKFRTPTPAQAVQVTDAMIEAGARAMAAADGWHRWQAYATMAKHCLIAAQPLSAVAQACAVRLEARPADNSKEWTEIFPAQLEWVAKEGHQVRAIELAAQPLAAPVETDDYTWYDAYNKLSAAYMGLIAERDAGAQCSAGSLSEEERHAINHARYQVEHASPEKPDCCFDFDLVTDLLRVIDRFSVSPQPSAGNVREAFDRLFPDYRQAGFTGGMRADYDIVRAAITSTEPQQLPVPWESLTAIIRPMIESVCSDGNSDAARLAKDIADRILASLSLTRPESK